LSSSHISFHQHELGSTEPQWLGL